MLFTDTYALEHDLDKKKSLFALNFNFQFSIFVNSDTISYFTIYTKESV